jgi:hypothetical protein
MSVPQTGGYLVHGPGIGHVLAGTGLLADDLWLLAHDDRTGRPFLHSRAAGLGMAGGLLGELLLAGVIRCDPFVVMSPEAGPPGDGLARQVAGVIAREPEVLDAGTWVQYLARTAASDVACRLASAGCLTAVPGRWRRGKRWRPNDPDQAFAPVTRAKAALDPGLPVTAESGALAGLATACGLSPRLLAYAPPGRCRDPDEVIAALPDGLREVITQTRAATDSAVLAQRM